MHWLGLLILMPYIYLILKIYLALRNIKPFQPETTPDIFISIIVACRNEEKRIPQLLDDISIQNYDQKSFEVIIVDDDSSDSTYEIASGYSRIKNIKVIKSKGKGKKSAVRTGIEESSGKLIITTDADCRAGSGWISTIISFYSVNKPDLIICPVSTIAGNGFINGFQELDFLSLQGVTAGTAIAGNPVMCNGANLAFSKETYIRHSGTLHDELVSGEDVFLLHGIKRDKGSRILWLESMDAAVTTSAAENPVLFLHQRARWISKAGTYNDKYSKMLGIVTFITVCFQVITLGAGLFNQSIMLLFAAGVLLKSIPDLGILVNTCNRYKKRNLLKWFLPAQLVYPFYVLTALILSFSHRQRW